MIDKEKLLQETNIIDVVSRRLDLKKQGNEHVGICPFHEDSKASLKVNEKKQVYKCFACGSGGNSIDFLTNLGLDFIQACDEISQGAIKFESTNQKKQTEKSKANELIAQFKFIGDAKPINEIEHWKYGKPSGVWPYYNENENIDFYACRFDLEEGEKQVLPLSYFECEKSGHEWIDKNGNPGGNSWVIGDKTWRWYGMPTPRILYNLHLLKKYPKATILLVEGEKCADHANKYLDLNKTIAMTWVGGANGIRNCDFTVLKGRNIIYWPDNDSPGTLAMQAIHDQIKTITLKNRWIYVPKEMPAKWDVADREWNGEEMKIFIRANMGDVPKPELVVPEKIEPVANTLPAKKPRKPKTDPTDNEHFRMLGYDKDETGKLVYFFFSHDAKAVIKLAPTSMSKSNLIPIAPLIYWEMNFPGSDKAKINIDSVQQFLIGQSHKVGIFRQKYIRGRGAWLEGSEIVIHSGTQIIKDGEYIKLREFHSKFVYEIGEDLGFKICKPLSNDLASKMLDKMKWLSWERDINAYLLAGWCVIAPFCGVMNWRPHIWVTGPSGAGKSHVMEKMIKILLGEAAISVQGKTTEAGVRGILQSDARPILFDESDVENLTDKERVQSILSLARSSSRKDGAQIAKGTQTGGSNTYEPKMCIALSSVGMQLNQRADTSRFTVLGLMSFEKIKTDKEFTQFDHDWSNLVNTEFVNALHYRTIQMLPIIIKNAEIFADVASQIIGNRRMGDQLGSMLAGAFSLTSRKLITHEKAAEWLANKDLTDEKSLEQTKDELQLLQTILGTLLKVELDGMTVDRTVGELIQYSLHGSVSSSDRLKRAGIMIVKDRVLFSNTSKSIKTMIYNTPWSNNHNRILERIDGAVRENPRTFSAGHSARAVSLPIEIILDNEEVEEIEEKTDELPF